MSLILHLSDLHLGSPSDWQLDYTDRFGLRRAAGDTKIDHLRRTLQSLGDALRAVDRELDAIVVSGDLTNANQPDGYVAFPETLQLLGDRLPANDRIVVVPGNHDADWQVQPGDARKFRRFLDAIRRDYPSPLVSGLDYDDTTLERNTGPRRRGRPILELADTAIIAISSADFCGAEEETTKTSWSDVVASYLQGDHTAAATAKRAQLESDLLRRAANRAACVIVLVG